VIDLTLTAYSGFGRCQVLFRTCEIKLDSAQHHHLQKLFIQQVYRDAPGGKPLRMFSSRKHEKMLYCAPYLNQQPRELMPKKSTKQSAKTTRKQSPRRKTAASAAKEENSPLSEDVVIVKRYGNRRLYNTETGSYVTYQDLIGIIRAGNDIQVIDSTTQADVTKAVLIQAILEEEKNQKNLLPLPFLFQILRSREDSVQDFFKNYLSASFEAYLKTKEEFDRRFRSFLGMGASAPQMWEQLIPGAEALKNILTPTKKDKDEQK